jgi:hypothetical protein
MVGSIPRQGPSFWNELYWFVAIGLLGWIVAALVLPPRVASTAQLLRQERQVLADIQALRRREDILEGAASAMENDPFYREGVFRQRLGLKKDSEEYLEQNPSPIR